MEGVVLIDYHAFTQLLLDEASKALTAALPSRTSRFVSARKTRHKSIYR